MPLRKAPTVQDGLRVVEIQGYDWSPCGGTHLASTGQIGALLLGRREKIRGRWRLEFLAGRRALAAGTAGLGLLRRLAEAATCAPAELESKLALLREESARLRKELQRARELLLAQEAAVLAQDDAEWEAMPGGGRLLVKDFGVRPPAELAQLAKLLSESPGRCLLWACRDEGRPRFHFQRSRGEGAHLGELLGRLLGERGGTGGGGPDRALGGLEGGDPAALLVEARRQLCA
jgi:alanyl-tRNA synthetase